MLHIARIEDAHTGVTSVLNVEVPVGASVVEKITERIHGYDWNLLDVTPMGEPDPPIEPDPRFPDRPTHPDLARLSAAAKEQDHVAETRGLKEALDADRDSVLYMAEGRITRALGPSAVRIDNLSLYLDAFQLGVGFANRGGHRPIETSDNAGEGGAL